MEKPVEIRCVHKRKPGQTCLAYLGDVSIDLSGPVQFFCPKCKISWSVTLEGGIPKYHKIPKNESKAYGPDKDVRIVEEKTNARF